MCVMCDGASHDEVMLRIAEKIHQNTVTFIPVIGGGYAYSIGMTGLGMPELYADFGSGFELELPHPKAEAMLAMAVQDVVEIILTEQVTPSILTVLKDPRATPAPFDIGFRRWGTEKMGVARAFYTSHEKPVRALRLQRLRTRGRAG